MGTSTGERIIAGTRRLTSRNIINVEGKKGMQCRKNIANNKTRMSETQIMIVTDESKRFGPLGDVYGGSVNV